MIKFEGTLCEQAKKLIVTKKRTSFLVCQAVTVLVFLVITIFRVKNSSNPWAYVLGMTLFVILINLVLALTINKKSKWLFPISVSVDNGEIVYETEGFRERYEFEKVKRVCDHGIFYEIIVSSHTLICQKDLLTQGTIEEFEALFDGKIERCENGI